MTVSATAREGIDRARVRVALERERAARAANIAARHEMLAVDAAPSLRTFHENAATAYRQMEARHAVSAGIQASHLARLSRVGKPDTPAAADLAAGEAVAGRPSGPESAPQAYDSLTGLPGRALFAEQLSQAMREPDGVPEAQAWAARRVAVCSIDLDNFRVINDRFGHDVGDHLLAALARRLSERLPGRLLAHLGADEFGVMLKLENTTGVEELTTVADEALAAIHEPINVDGHEFRLSASAGLVEQDAAGADFIELMRAADITLSWAKRGGGGRWELFDRDRSDRAIARYALAAGLPAAIDRGELFLEYQPIVSLSDRSLVGAEALVRWRHPDLGVLSPDLFIDLAEETGLIVDLGRSVLEQACREAARWIEVTPNTPYVSVNVASRQVHDTDLVAEVASVLERSGLPPSRLVLEITEGVVLSPEDEAVSVLRDLVATGVRLAIDDFGTGYSNLSYLRRLPVQILKIDRSFVSGFHPPAAPGESGALEILEAMVALAHALGLTATAEGVETAEQADWLGTIGCDSAQGWHFGRPTRAAEIPAITRRGPSQ